MENNHPELSMASDNMAAAAMNTQWGIDTVDNVSMTQNNMPCTSTIPGTMGTVQTSGSNINPINLKGMPGENGVIGMCNGQKNMMVPQVKEVVNFSKGVLLPPNPNATPPSTRKKPRGCKTVFVGGLPEKIKEEIIKEIFEKSGEIDRIRMSRKNFCHIRFKEAASIERALYYSGYKMKIDNNDDPSFTGRLHVDYAVTRDDQHEYEYQQRMIQQAQRHQELECFKSVTPPIIAYTGHEASLLGEKLKREDSFMQAACVLINWLERGECTRWSAGSFYSMIQSANSQIRRQITEEEEFEEQLNDVKGRLKKQMEGITHQFSEIEKVFEASYLQRIWDHFTKVQRKNIELWRKQIEEMKNAHVKEVINERRDEGIDVNDNESGYNITKCSLDTSSSELAEEISKLRQENNFLRCQLKFAQNEIAIRQAETKGQLNRQKQKISSAIQNSKRCCKEAPVQDSLKSQRSVNKDETEVDHNDFESYEHE